MTDWIIKYTVMDVLTILWTKHLDPIRKNKHVHLHCLLPFIVEGIWFSPGTEFGAQELWTTG